MEVAEPAVLKGQGSARASVGKDRTMPRSMKQRAGLSLRYAIPFSQVLSFNVVRSPTPAVVTGSDSFFPLTVMVVLFDCKKQVALPFLFMILRKKWINQIRSEKSEWA